MIIRFYYLQIIRNLLIGYHNLKNYISSYLWLFILQLDQIEFHWGESKGSEHLIDGKQFFMEMQMLHYKTEYHYLDVAASKPDGIAAFSILFEVRLNFNISFSNV